MMVPPPPRRADFVIYKAQGQHVPDMILSAMTPCPDGPPLSTPDTIVERQGFFRDQAREVAAALRASLPGGTLDALLVELELFQAKASVFVVR